VRLTNDELVLEAAAARSGVTLLAREISQILREVYNRELSPKSVSKSMAYLCTVNDFVNSRRATGREKSLYNCKMIYLFGFFDPKTGEVA